MIEETTEEMTEETTEEMTGGTGIEIITGDREGPEDGSRIWMDY